jgi:hypothetical protein
MIVKSQLGLLIPFIETLGKVAQSDLPVIYAFNLRKLMRNIQEEMKLLEEQRVAMVQKYSKEGENQVAQENQQEFFDKFNELLATECEIESPLDPIAVGELSKMNIKLNVNDIDLLIRHELVKEDAKPQPKLTKPERKQKPTEEIEETGKVEVEEE